MSRLIACARCTALMRIIPAEVGTHVECQHCGHRELTVKAIKRTDEE